MVSRIKEQAKANLDKLRLGTSTWADQFRNAMNVNGGDVENATTFDYIMHFCTFFWKVNTPCESITVVYDHILGINSHCPFQCSALKTGV